MKGYSLITSIFQQIYIYQSTFYPLKGLLELAYYHRNQLEGYTMAILKKILYLIQSNKMLQEYIIQLPSCNYCFAKYLDWVKPFILEQICENQKAAITAGYGNQNRKDLAEFVLSSFEQFEYIAQPLLQKKRDSDLVQIIDETQYNQQLKHINSLSNSLTDAMFSSAYQPYILGKIIKNEIVEEKLIYEQGQDFIKLSVNELTTHFMKSVPTGNSNLAFPNTILKNGYFLFKHVTPESTLFNVIDKFKPQQKQTNEEQKEQTAPPPPPGPIDDVEKIIADVVTLTGPMLRQFQITSNIAVPFIMKLQFTISNLNENIIEPIFPMNLALELKPSNDPQIIFTIDKKRPELFWMKLDCTLLSIQFLQGQQNTNQNNINSVD